MSNATETRRRCRFLPSVYIFATYEGISARPIDDRPEPMPSPLNYPAYLGLRNEGGNSQSNVHSTIWQNCSIYSFSLCLKFHCIHLQCSDFRADETLESFCFCFVGRSGCVVAGVFETRTKRFSKHCRLRLF